MPSLKPSKEIAGRKAVFQHVPSAVDLEGSDQHFRNQLNRARATSKSEAAM